MSIQFECSNIIGDRNLRFSRVPQSLDEPFFRPSLGSFHNPMIFPVYGLRRAGLHGVDRWISPQAKRILERAGYTNSFILGN